MAELRIDFQWWRDAKGYRLLKEEPPKPQRRTTGTLDLAVGGPTIGALGLAAGIYLPESLLGGDHGKPERVVRRGGQLTPYRPLAEVGDALFHLFVNAATTPTGVLNFIERFGPLTPNGLDAQCGEDVPDMIQHADAMRRWLDGHRVGSKAALARMIGPEGVRFARIAVRLAVDPMTGAPKVQLTVDNLLAALWLQLGQALSGGAIIRQCQHCGTLFETGPGTRRRADAKFCSDEHRIAFNSVKRSREN